MGSALKMAQAPAFRSRQRALSMTSKSLIGCACQSHLLAHKSGLSAVPTWLPGVGWAGVLKPARAFPQGQLEEVFQGS